MSSSSALRRLSVLAGHGLRAASSSAGGKRVCVIGAAGGIGQPLAMLLKMNPSVSHLSLYDMVGTPGVAADLSHVNTKAVVTGFVGEEQLGAALAGCDLVIIPAGVPRKPGMTRDDLFKINAGIVKGLVTAVGKHCPGAWVNMISNPVNSTVPIAAETLKALGCYDPKKLFGVTTLDVVRARTFLAEKKGLDVAKVDVPVVGGHAGITILPLFSKATPAAALTPEETDALTKRTQDGGTEVVAAKAGKGSATLSMAYAGALFADACLRAMLGDKGVAEYTYVQSTVQPGVTFFSSRVVLGRSGAEKIEPVGPLTPYEEAALAAMIPELADSIAKGVAFVKENP